MLLLLLLFCLFDRYLVLSVNKIVDDNLYNKRQTEYIYGGHNNGLRKFSVCTYLVSETGCNGNENQRW